MISTVPVPSDPRPGPMPRSGSCLAITKVASKSKSAPSGGCSGARPSVSAPGSYSTPGGTPKNTAHVDDPLRRPRYRPGHWNLCGSLTGTNPRFRTASHWLKPTHPSPGTSESSTPSTYATQAVSKDFSRSFFCSNSTLPSRAVRCGDFSHGAGMTQRGWWGVDHRSGDKILPSSNLTL
jgi:hypothetical protein